MRLRLQSKLVGLMLFAAILPLGLAGLSAVYIAQKTTQSQIREAHLIAAAHAASDIDHQLDIRIDAIARGANSFELEALDESEQLGALRLLYRQVDGLDIVGVVDEQGTPVVEPVSLTDPKQRVESLASRELRDAGARTEFVRHIPVTAALEQGRAISDPYADPPRVAIAVRNHDWVVAGEVSLERVTGQLDGLALGGRAEAFVVAGNGTVVATGRGSTTGVGVQVGDHEMLRALLAEGKPGALVGRSPIHDEKALVAFVPVGSTGWGVTVVQPTRHAFVAARSLRWQTLFWVAVSAALAVILGTFYARRLIEPVTALSRGAQSFASGDLQQRIEVDTGDEIEDLAKTFNQMASELSASFDEIERWNQELAERVEARTRELAEAQSELFQSRKLAAVGELGAGVAHELNNPLTAVVGFANVMLEKSNPEDPNRRFLELVHDAGRRCAEIVESLLRFSESVKRGEWELVDVNRAARDAITVLPFHLKDDDIISLEVDLASDLPLVFGAPGELRTALYQVLANAHTAVRDGGTVKIRSTSDGENVFVQISDDGEGMDEETLQRAIEPFFTSQRPERKGLGLSVAYGIVRDHDGQIELESQPGKGTVVTLAIPTAELSKKARAARLANEDVALEGQDQEKR